MTKNHDTQTSASAPGPFSVSGWLAGRLPQDWFETAPEVVLDREEITVIGRLTAPELPEGSSDADRAGAAAGRIREFRERTRGDRIAFARELEHTTGRKVAWGAESGERRELFTTLSVPVMTRLRQADRLVLDTLVEAGVARSRSDALAWCVRLVGRNADEWLARLRAAREEVERVREEGPDRD